MTEPGANRVDIHAGSQQVGSCCMADGVWTDAFAGHGRKVLGCSLGMAFDHRVDPVTSQRVSLPIKENVIRIWAAFNQMGKFLDGYAPERTAAQFVTFATNHHSRAMPAGRDFQSEVVNLNMCGLVSPSTCVVKKEQQSMIAPALGSLHVR